MSNTLTKSTKPALSLQESWKKQAGRNPKQKSPPAPFSLRLTPDERSRLEMAAAGKPLGAYIRSQLLGVHATKRRVQRKPSLNNVVAAQALAGLGQSRLASNLNQIAKAANLGVIDVSDELIFDLQEACRHIREMRDELISALAVKPEDGT